MAIRDKIEANSHSLLNTLCSEHVKDNSGKSDEKFDVNPSVLQTLKKLQKKINEALPSVRTDNLIARELLNGNQNSSFVKFATEKFGNFTSDEYPKLDFKIKVESSISVESFFPLSLKNNEDLMLYVLVPAQFFYKSDIRNYRLFQKLNLVLLAVLEVLRNDNILQADDWKLFGFQGGQFEPLIFDHCFVKAEINQQSQQKRNLSLKMTCVPETVEKFDLKKLSRDKSNLSFSYLKKSVQENLLQQKEETPQTPSSLYNQTVLSCLWKKMLNKSCVDFYSKLPEVYKNCLSLIVTWTTKSNFDHLLNIEVLLNSMKLLLSSGKISETGSNYEGVFDAFSDYIKFLNQIVSENFRLSSNEERGILFVESGFCPGLNMFRHFSPIDASILKKSLLAMVNSFNDLGDQALNAELFVADHAIFALYDLIFSFGIKEGGLTDMIKPESRLTYSCNPKLYAIERLVELLHAAFGEKVSSIDPIEVPGIESEYKLKEMQVETPEEPSAKKSRQSSEEILDGKMLVVNIGVKLNPKRQPEAVIRGPLPDNKKDAEKFRELWGPELCKLRRFKDGTICYAVSFPEFAGSKQKLRNVASEIIKHIVTFHLGPENIAYLNVVSDKIEFQLVDKLKNSYDLKGTGEEEIQRGKDILSDFESVLLDISGKLPLQLKSVTCLNDDVNRNSSVVPPSMQHDITWQKLMPSVHGVVCVPDKETHLAEGNIERIRSVDIQLMLETNDKWPSNNFEAIKRLKAAFYLKIHELLRDKKIAHQNIQSFATFDALIALFDKQVFRVNIFHPPEISMQMRELKTPKGAKYWEHSADSRKTTLEQVLRPKLRVMLEGFEQFFPQFGPICRLVKLWMSCQLMMFEFGNVVVELLVAAMLEHSFKRGDVPCCMQSGLLEFWRFISTFNFVTNYITLRLEDPTDSHKSEQSDDEEDVLGMKFDFNRANFPPLTIFTPVKSNESIFTMDLPPVLLTRLCNLSSAALQKANGDLNNFLVPVIGKNANDSDFDALFTPDYRAFDLVLRLKEDMICSSSNFYQNRESFGHNRENYFVDRGNTAFARIDPIPLYNVNVPEMVSKRLKEKLGHILLVFFDSYSIVAKRIGLKFKKSQNVELNKWLTDNLDQVKEQINLMVGPGALDCMKEQKKNVSA